MDGLTDELLAGKMGISRSTLNEWKLKFPDISDTIKRGKEIADIKVENALFKKATGYIYTDKNGDEKYVPADTTAIIFWLKNRRPDKWRDKSTAEATTPETVRIILERRGTD